MGPFFFLLLCLLASRSASESDTVVVVTSSGPVKGKQVPAGSGSVTAYLGIPYAEPPLGKLRLQKPRPHQPWSHLLEATSYGNSCIPEYNYSFPDTRTASFSTSGCPIHDPRCLFLSWFGGDPALLTLFGNSAGGASVGYHLLSPASQPLFAHAVLQSGAPNAHWAWKDPEDAKSDALIIGTKLGCTEQNQSSLVSCLQGNNIGDKELYRLSTLFSVTTDGEFLLDEPLKLLQSGAVQSKPVLTGVTHDEGTVFVLASFPKTKSDDVILTLNDIIVGLNSTVCEDTVKAIAVRYSEGAPAPKSYHHILAEYFKDVSFVCPCTQFASKMAEAGSPVYVYSFKLYTPRAEWPKWMGTTHGDELPYLFGTPATVLGTDQTDVDVALIHKVMRYWAEFARSRTGMNCSSHNCSVPCCGISGISELLDVFCPLE
ncbi:cholinesterase-like [Elgaria multicarinata webbii]|uniref:cholinesterase-like n=1 Tax=Elgaria multicarinata webbii TaxID=159646 RepID=UPI002FCCE49D